jgi:hypothetical protein
MLKIAAPRAITAAVRLVAIDRSKWLMTWRARQQFVCKADADRMSR